MKRLFFCQVILLLLFIAFTFSDGIERDWRAGNGEGGLCKYRSLGNRPHSVSILEFGAVGDGKTLNTIALQNAIFYVKSFADKGGAQLYVPPGRWLTGSFNLTSHLTLFLASGATILGWQDISQWEIIAPLPSYGRGIETPRGRYRSLINGKDLTDVVITGDDGTIDGQGSVWWEQFSSQSLNHSRPHLVEFVSSNNILISNVTFLNSPAWDIHAVYCSNVQIQNITARAPPESPLTSGIVPDSSDNVCIENCNISTGHDAIVLKSGWDEYGIAYDRPTTKVHIREVQLRSFSGAGLAFGSEMSGGISSIIAEGLSIRDSSIGIQLKTTRGRGGYIEDIVVSNVNIKNVGLALEMTGDYGSHPDEGFDPQAVPVMSGVTFKDVVGENISIAGNFSGIQDSPFTSICMSNITLSMTVTPGQPGPWACSNVSGLSEDVTPEPCRELNGSSLLRLSSTCSVGLSARSMR